MTRRKPTDAYRVTSRRHPPILVLARHPKGALSVAQAHAGAVLDLPDVKPAAADLADQAVNAKQGSRP